MRTCFAVEKDDGIESEVYPHFHSALMFLIYDSETENITLRYNEDLNHPRGACNPIKAVGEPIDALVVHGIGLPALSALNGKGVKVYTSIARTVSQNLRLMKRGTLPLVGPQDACCGFRPPGGCPTPGEAACSRKDNSGLIGYPT